MIRDYLEERGLTDKSEITYTYPIATVVFLHAMGVCKFSMFLIRSAPFWLAGTTLRGMHVERIWQGSANFYISIPTRWIPI